MTLLTFIRRDMWKDLLVGFPVALLALQGFTRELQHHARIARLSVGPVLRHQPVLPGQAGLGLPCRG